jgi:hypothetical protein
VVHIVSDPRRCGSEERGIVASLFLVLYLDAAYL